MGHVDTRQIERDSFLLLAEIRLERGGRSQQVKIRNLSSRGMMAEGQVVVLRGSPVTLELRGVGEVLGVVAWVEKNRFGVEFAEDIDPRLARSHVAAEAGALASPRFTRPPIHWHETGTRRTI